MKPLFVSAVLLIAASSAWGQLPSWAAARARPAPGTSAAATSIHPAVVRIIAPGKDSVSYGSGTLVAVNEKHGLVITNWHVINEATGPITVVFPDGFQSGGSVQKIDRDWDLAAISIWKPNVAPVPLATTAPRPGEPLTIAGYGSGNYRAVTGPCTQYVAPGLKFPYEMVELAASARQGDSGGPIFNSRGELAGVLFGEGHGRTSGSYCGRVQWFIASFIGPQSPADTMIAAAIPQTPPAAAPAGPQHAPPATVANALPATTSAEADSEPYIVSLPPTATTRRASIATSRPAAQPPELPAVQPSMPVPVPITTSAPIAEASPIVSMPPERDLLSSPVAAPRTAGSVVAEQAGWQDAAGESVGDQIKTFLAIVGAIAMVMHILRWMGSGS